MLSSRRPAKSSTYSLQVARLQASDFGAGAAPQWPRPATAPAMANPSLGSAPSAIAALDRVIPLPASLRSLTIYLVALLLVAAGMVLHVALAAQIQQVQVEIDVMKETHAHIESQNAELIWEIARRSNLEQIQQTAYAQGYRPINRRQYVYVTAPSRTVAAPAVAPVVAARAEPRRGNPLGALALAVTTPIPEESRGFSQLAQWWEPWQERITETVSVMLARVWGS